VTPRPPRKGNRVETGELQVVPVKSGDERVGLLLLVSRCDATPFAAADDRLLSLVAAQLGLTMERIQLRRQATETEILRRADDLKTALLNAVSHDLRTPLASIIASAGSLLQQDVAWSDQERREFAEGTEEEARRLTASPEVCWISLAYRQEA